MRKLKKKILRRIGNLSKKIYWWARSNEMILDGTYDRFMEQWEQLKKQRWGK